MKSLRRNRFRARAMPPVDGPGAGSAFAITVSLAVCLAVGTGCREDSPSAASAPSRVDADVTSTIAWREGMTADDRWAVAWRPLAEPIPALDPFAVEVRVTDSEGRPVESEVSILVDAAMPHHGHGMNVSPRISRRSEDWIAEGMLFHMPGRWEFVVDVVRNGEVERAQWTVMLDN
ncbi:MAG: hypothetical protein CMJ51_05510 [Planctomycetaceae bacterium]|nr:hypothetical protein [Planctomycetaceae bacterium]